MRLGACGAEPSSSRDVPDMPRVATLPALSVAVITWSSFELFGILNVWLKLPLALVVSGLSGGEFMVISSYLMETWLLVAKPLPLSVTSPPISGCSGSRIILGWTWRLALMSPMNMSSVIALNSCLPAMVSGMVNWASKLPLSLAMMLSLVSLPSKLILMSSFLAGKPVPLMVTLEPGEADDGVTLMLDRTVKVKPYGDSGRQPRRNWT